MLCCFLSPTPALRFKPPRECDVPGVETINADGTIPTSVESGIPSLNPRIWTCKDRATHLWFAFVQASDIFVHPKLPHVYSNSFDISVSKTFIPHEFVMFLMLSLWTISKNHKNAPPSQSYVSRCYMTLNCYYSSTFYFYHFVCLRRFCRCLFFPVLSCHDFSVLLLLLIIVLKLCYSILGCSLSSAHTICR